MKSLALFSASMGTQYGGTETFVQTLAAHLVHRIQDVRLITGGHANHCKADFRALLDCGQLKSLHLPFWDRHSKMGRFLAGNFLGRKISPTDLESMTTLLFVKKLSRFVQGCDLFEAHYPLDGLLFPFLPRKMKKVLHFHGTGLPPLFRRCRKYIFRYTDGCVACSSYARNELTKVLPEMEINVLHNGVDIRQFSPGSTTFVPGVKYDSSCLKVGLVARLSREKGCDLIREVSGKLRGEVEFFLVGLADSGYSGELKKIKNLPNVHLLGAIDHNVIGDFYRFIDCFTLPSHFEAFPLTILEAMASGCAVLATDVGGIPEMVGRSGEAGLLFPVDDQTAFIHLLRCLGDEKEMCRNLGLQARIRVEDNFSLESTADGAMALYDRFLLPHDE